MILIYALIIGAAWYFHLPPAPALTATSANVDAYRALITADQDMAEGMAKLATGLLFPLLTFLVGAALGKRMNIAGDG